MSGLTLDLSSLDRVRSAYSAFNAADLELFLAHLDPDVRWYTPTLDLRPELYRGREAVRDYLTTVLTPDVRFTSEPVALAEARGRVVAAVLHRGTHLASGARTSFRTAQVWEVRELITRYRLYLDSAKAVRGLGLTDPTLEGWTHSTAIQAGGVRR